MSLCMELTGGICSWRIQLRVEDSPDFFQRFATIQFLLLEQGIGDMTRDIGQENSPSNSLVFTPVINTQTAVKPSLCGPCADQFHRFVVRARAWRNWQLVDFHRSITLGTLKNILSDSGAFANA